MKQSYGAWRYCLRHPAVRAGVWSLAVSLLLLAGAVMAWWPAQGRVKQLEQELAALEQSLREQQRAGQVLAAYERAQASSGVLTAKLEYAGTQAQLVEDLAQLAHASGVRIISEAYSEGRAAGALGVLNTDLAVRGDYGSVRQFLGTIPSLPTWSEINEVVLEKAREPEMVNGKLRIVTYRSSAAQTP